MLREWTDKLPTSQADEVWRTQQIEASLRDLSGVERALKDEVEAGTIAPTGFFEAMRHFITLRETMFPSLPADPAWSILVTLASTEEGDARSSVTGIAYGAGVPLTTAIRYIGILEVDGIVERVADPVDSRRVFIRLTPEGRRRLDVIESRWKARAAMLMLLVPSAVVAVLLAAGAV